MILISYKNEFETRLKSLIGINMQKKILREMASSQLERCLPVLGKVKVITACLSSVKEEDVALLVESVQRNI